MSIVHDLTTDLSNRAISWAEEASTANAEATRLEGVLESVLAHLEDKRWRELEPDPQAQKQPPEVEAARQRAIDSKYANQAMMQRQTHEVAIREARARALKASQRVKGARRGVLTLFKEDGVDLEFMKKNAALIIEATKQGRANWESDDAVIAARFGV